MHRISIDWNFNYLWSQNSTNWQNVSYLSTVLNVAVSNKGNISWKPENS